MTVFGDLDTSTLSELPSGRAPLTTHVVPERERPGYLARAWERVREEVAGGGRAYVVCPRIGGETGRTADDEVDADEDAGQGAEGATVGRPPVAVLDLVDVLVNGPLAGLRVGALHGRMRSDDKDAAMRGFAEGDLDVLVATTVVEVGVDVPEATVMVVMDADRFGVSQLHQLRGRVGRGGRPGLCLLVTAAPTGSPARARLDAVASTTDGFVLAQVDLHQRREGDVLGAVQSGRRSSLRLLSVLDDEDVIVRARAAAERVVDADPDLRRHPALAAALAAVTQEASVDYLAKS
jgi:ATP-dependent DNA helicase RecG